MSSLDHSHVEIFDTTLRDGLQVEGVSASVDDKLRIAEQLDHLGVHYIEGGWPGANPKDIEFFARASAELDLATSTLVAFGSTRRPKGKVDDDAPLQNLLDANTAAVCIVAKSSRYHVEEALRTTLDEGEAPAPVQALEEGGFVAAALQGCLGVGVGDEWAARLEPAPADQLGALPAAFGEGRHPGLTAQVAMYVAR